MKNYKKEYLRLKNAVLDYLDDLSKGGYNSNGHRKYLGELTGFDFSKI